MELLEPRARRVLLPPEPRRGAHITGGGGGGAPHGRRTAEPRREGEIAPIEASRARVALNQTRLARFDADQELAAARIRLALVNRADLRAALAEYEASQPALQLEIARQHPDIHLGPGYERDQSDNKWKLGLSFELPRWNRHEGPIAEAEATRAECARFSTRSSARP